MFYTNVEALRVRKVSVDKAGVKWRNLVLVLVALQVARIAPFIQLQRKGFRLAQDNFQEFKKQKIKGSVTSNSIAKSRTQLWRAIEIRVKPRIKKKWRDESRPNLNETVVVFASLHNVFLKPTNSHL